MMGKIRSDLFFQEHYTLNGVDMKICLVQSRSTLYLMASGVSYGTKIKVSLVLRKI